MRRSLRSQLLVSHLLPVGLMLLALVGAMADFFRLGQSVDHILRDNYDSVVAAQDMKESLERIESSTTKFLAGQPDRARRQYNDNLPRFERAYNIEAHNITEPGEKELADDIGRRFAHYHVGVEKLLRADPALAPSAARAQYGDSLEPEFTLIKQDAQEVLTLNQTAMLRSDERAKSEARRDVLLGTAATLGALLLASSLALRQIRAIATPLVTLTRQAEEIGAGRLNQRIDGRREDEVGQLARTFNSMAEKLQEARRIEAERLLRAERMSDAALENLYDPVIVTDADGRVVHLNRAAEALFGPDSRAHGVPAREVVREPRLAHAIERAVGHAQTSAEEGEASLIAFDRDGARAVGDRRGTFRLRVSPMRAGSDESGELLGAVAVLEDVTHLAELDRLKTEFIGVASHELRTPVTSMLLGVQLLQEGAIGPLTPDQQAVVNATGEDLRRLERMMRDLLDLTRLEGGASPPHWENVAPADLVGVAASSVAAQAEARGVRLTVNVADAALPLVRADRGQMTRVLINLLNNAVRHTPRGGSVQMTASATGSGVRFAVADTGSGIPAEYRTQIFERFVQVPGATRGGAGLGLSISQSIVRAHGGEITVESTVGVGSTFSFTIPMATLVAPADVALPAKMDMSRSEAG